jgi:hypothetical protein
MKRTLTAAACAAFAVVLTLSQPALSQQKTARQCSDEWTAGKAAIQAAGKTKRVFVAECRGLPVTAAAPTTPAALAKGQYATESEARTSCPADAVVWVNLRSRVYHGSDSRSYGKTQQGVYMCEKESVAAGFHAPKRAIRGAKPAAA